MKTTPTHIQLDNNRKLDIKEKEIKSIESPIKFQWISYREAKFACWNYYQTHYSYLHPETGGHLALPILVMWLLAVYFLDLVFSYNIAEYQAKQSFHGNPYAILLATLIFPLAFIPIVQSELVRYIIRYIARDYYHIPAGEEPGFDDRDGDDVF